MGSLYYVGFNAFQQCPNDGKTTFPKVIREWTKFSFTTPGEIKCTFRNVIINIDKTIVIYGLINETCSEYYRSINCHVSPKTFHATDDYIIISEGNKLWKSPYNDQWSEVSYSFYNEEDLVLWNDKEIKKICSICSEQDLILLLNDGSVWKLDRGNQLSIVYSPILDKAVDISCGFEHGLVLTENGCVISFGGGSHGQLGHGDLNPTKDSLQVLGLGGLKVVKIAAAGWHSSAITDSGDLYFWGWNNSGQLTEIKDDGITSGDGYGVTALPVLTDIDPDREIAVIDVDCGVRHTVVMTGDNEYFSTGWNEYGQLGINDVNSEKVNKFTKIRLPPSKRKRRLICGPWSTLLYEDNEVL